jgi:hypothetical protein
VKPAELRKLCTFQGDGGGCPGVPVSKPPFVNVAKTAVTNSNAKRMDTNGGLRRATKWVREKASAERGRVANAKRQRRASNRRFLSGERNREKAIIP